MIDFPMPNELNSNYKEEYDKYMKHILSNYESCSICMNEMILIHSSNGNYWRCKVCNNIRPAF